MPAGLLVEWEAFRQTVIEDEERSLLEAKAVSKMRGR
jgi:hypothetical protein